MNIQRSAEEDSLIKVIHDPEIVRQFNLGHWDRLLRQARNTLLLPRLAVELAEKGIVDGLPGRVRDHLIGAKAIAEQHERIMRWEIHQIARALASLRIPVVLLKGAAYLMASLPPARGRLSCDVDILVSKDNLDLAESALRQHGWCSLDLDPYDQRYYRKWMHELPPLRHTDRHTTLDVHHTILPESGRLHPDPAELIRSARPIDCTSFYLLAPIDMVLHCAAHMFQDGDLTNGLRNLLDIDDLLRHFDREGEFLEQLVPRSRSLELDRPLFYALRYANKVLKTPVPQEVTEKARASAPSKLILGAMDYLVDRALVPIPQETATQSIRNARSILYVRSHWLRMPPVLLIQHLARKAFRRWIEWWEKRKEVQDIQHAQDKG